VRNHRISIPPDCKKQVKPMQKRRKYLLQAVMRQS
jgi:hypothetical protein